MTEADAIRRRMIEADEAIEHDPRCPYKAGGDCECEHITIHDNGAWEPTCDHCQRDFYMATGRTLTR